jgi:hypothetical protein
VLPRVGSDSQVPIEALSAPSIAALRVSQVAGYSRRTLLFVAFVGLAIRAADAAPRAAIMAVALLAVGFGSWLAALLATAVGIADGATLGAAQALAMIGAIAIGILLIRVGDDRLGVLAVIGSGVMFVPWTGSWLIAGAAWTAIGIDLLVQWAQPQNGRQVVP